MPARKDKTAGLNHEYACLDAGYSCVVGMDEAGRGPWAGIVAAGAVALPLQQDTLAETLHGARDSKDMTAHQRVALSQKIRETALGCGVGCATVAEINTLGIMPALKLAFARALEQVRQSCQPDVAIIDYVPWHDAGIPVHSIKFGDSLSLSIACASILAKTWRDEQMRTLGEQYPQYGFEQHKGYGTAAHKAAIQRYGVLPGVHRETFKPIIALQASAR